MLSVLIPTYNYDVSELINEVYKQLAETGIVYEILCKDDASDCFLDVNKACVKEIPNATFFTAQENCGRTATRQFLCKKAKYDWLLFLDADVIPKNDTFIKNYILQISTSQDAIFGGFAYDLSMNVEKGILRWKYGKTYEEVDAEKRNTKPYELIISANFLIRKDVFSSINSRLNRNGYGLDNYFSALLRQENVNVFHINNEVYHYGLEDNEKYIKKSEEAIETLLWMCNAKKVKTHNNKLLKTYSALKAIKLHHILAFFYKMFYNSLRKNLLSPQPNVRLLQVYKLLYISYKDLS